MNNLDKQKALEKCFYDYRAENLTDIFSEIFVEPPFFSDLAGSRPCFLVGGRGTGKTTALKSLKYDPTITSPDAQLGIYLRINKNQVHCFQSDLHNEVLSKAFCHYMNLLVARECCQLLLSMQSVEHFELERGEVNMIQMQLGIGQSNTLTDLEDSIKKAIISLEIFVNNIDASYEHPPIFSIPESPIKELAAIISKKDSRQRPLLCCIDEYENLLDYQQAIVNTYIKHAELPLSYKIGIKYDGLKTRDTLTTGDPLRSPADYMEIDLASNVEDNFLKMILQRRIDLARKSDINIPSEPNEFIKPLSRLDEALLLGAGNVAKSIRKDLANNIKANEWARNIPDGDLILVKYRAEVEESNILTMVDTFRMNDGKWQNVKNNHGYPSLFWLSLGRKGVNIKKYYCGLNSITRIANGNIRFFLEVIGDAVRNSIDDISNFSNEHHLVIDPIEQTKAARSVATRQLEQLDSLGKYGGELKRLVLGIGKIFFELTRRPSNRAPEPTSFVLSGLSEDIEYIQNRLSEGIANSVFIGSPRTKLTSSIEIREYEYSLHPILSPFFEISFRKKRRITLSATSLKLLRDNPKGAMAELFKKIDSSAPDELPDHLLIFWGLFENE